MSKEVRVIFSDQDWQNILEGYDGLITMIRFENVGRPHDHFEIITEPTLEQYISNHILDYCQIDPLEVKLL